MRTVDLDKLVAERAAKRPVALVTDLKSGVQEFIYDLKIQTNPVLAQKLL